MGADGLLGRRLTSTLLAAGHEVAATTRRPPRDPQAFAPVRLWTGIDVRSIADVVRCAAESRPDVIVNCAGVVKRRPGAGVSELIAVNSLFPHELADVAAAVGARLIHLSTDCVFSGERGAYVEDDRPDPVDSYGHSKLLGEVDAPGALTIRTSMIGVEEAGQARNLVEWYLGQTAPVEGWTRAVFSGLTTAELSRVLLRVIEDGAELHGVWHVSAEPIDKHHRLSLIHARVEGTAEVVASDRVVIDRSLKSDRFRAVMDWMPPSWERMIDELAAEVRERTPSGRA